MEENLAKRVMPQDQDAERSVIGAMLIDREAIAAAMEILKRDDFYFNQYGLLFAAVTELYDEGSAVDTVLLQDRCRKMDAPPEVANIEFLASIIADTPDSTRVREYAKIVSDKAALRRLIRANEEVASACYEGTEKVEDLMAQAGDKIFKVLQQRTTKDFDQIRDVTFEVLSDINTVSKQKGQITGIETGFSDLDFYTSGLQRSDLILLAARPSMGKTAFALNIADYVSTHGKYAAIFSLEMSSKQLVMRLLAMESKVEAQLLRNGNLADQDWANLMIGADAVGNSGLMIDDTPGITVAEVRSKCRKAKLEGKLDIILIDYLQLMSGSGNRKGESRQQEISDISRSLKALARELDVPVIALSQLSRAVEQRPDHRPQLSDLRESGAIEQDADVVMFLYRDEYYNHDSPKKGLAELIIAKQRNGPTTSVDLVWMPRYTKFGNAEKMDQGNGI